jgi:hypothetical protein
MLIAVVAAGYLLVGSLIAWAVNASFDISGPKWIVLPAFVLLWPLSIVLPVIFVLFWTRNGIH